MSRMRWRGTSLFAAMMACTMADPEPTQFLNNQLPLALQNNHDIFDWQQITPSPQLEYVRCYDGFECARLDVPLNWNATDEARAAVALIRLPAKVPVRHESYGGIILVNPGGPGESGVDQVLSRGRSIQTIVNAAGTTEGISIDTPTRRYFDIVGFDPRGVKYTTPALHCFSDAFSQQMWLLNRPLYSEIYSSDASFAVEWARTEALGRTCSVEHNGAEMFRYANTAQTVEDMVGILEQHGQWRQKEAVRSVEEQKESLSAEEASAILARTAYRPEQEMLQYWGVSYGSLLGQTFAAMHPDRVGKIVIDGVLDPDDYYRGAWLANLQDSDKVMSRLCEYCFKAGPSKCSLYVGSGAGDICEVVETLIRDLKNNPIVVKDAGAGLSDSIVVTFDDYYLRAINAMAFPFAAAEDFFRLLADLRNGNVTEVALSKQAQLDMAASLASCRTSSNGCMPESYFGLLGPTPAIECMDSAGSRKKKLTKQVFEDYFSELFTQSEWFAPSWARHRMSCIGMGNGPVWTHDGDITANTSRPILIIGNTLDTVTPLRNARKVATLFPGSIVLQQDSEGHCSHANPSSCTAQHVRHYFQTGRLPKQGTVCEPDWRPFIGKSRERFGHDLAGSDGVNVELGMAAADIAGKQLPRML